MAPKAPKPEQKDQARQAGRGPSSDELTALRAENRELRKRLARIEPLAELANENPLLMIQDKELVWINEAVSDLTGYPPDEALGRSFLEEVSPEQLIHLIQARERFLSDGTLPDPFETGIRTKNGEKLRVLVNLRGVTFRDRPAVIVSLRDITEQSRIEEELRLSEERFRAAFESHPQAIVLSRLEDGKFFDLNESYAEITGYSREDIIGRTSLEVGIWSDPSERTEFTAEIREKGFVDRFQCAMRFKNGQIQPVVSWARKIALHGEDLVVSVVRQINELDQAREEIRSREELYRSAMEAAAEPFIVYDSEGRVTYLNPAFTQLFGWTMEEARGHLMDFVPEHLKAETLRIVEGIMDGDRCSDYETLRLSKSGQLIEVRISAAAYRNREGEPQGLVVNLRDIRERKRAEAINSCLFTISRAVYDTRGLDELYRTIHLALEGIIDTTNFFIATYDQDQDIISFPYFIDQMDDNFEILNATDSTSLTVQVITTKEPLLLNDRDFLPDADGDGPDLIGTTPRSWLGVPLLIEGQAVGAIVVQSYSDPEAYTAKDQELLTSISNYIAIAVERGRDRDRLRRSEMRYRQTFEGIHDPIIITSRQAGRILYVNDSLHNLTGFGPEAGASPGSGRGSIPAALESSILELNGDLETAGDREITFPAKDGRTVTLLVSTQEIEFDEEPAWLTIGRDITALRETEEQTRRLENQLRQAQKMEAVGTLAGGIAHDFNNILQAIGGYAQLLKNSREITSGDRGYIESIDRSADRAGRLIRQLLTFSRRVEPEHVPVDLRLEIGLSVGLLEQTIPKMIEIRTEIEPDLKPVLGDAGQLGQIILNLGTNARDSMSEGGRLTIRAANEYLDERACSEMVDCKPGEYVRLTVADNGQGMTEETRRKIFEPFFTTKEVGRGSGLGLSMVYGIVRNHEGFISCASAPGQGTVMTVYLPQAGTKPEITESERVTVSDQPPGRGTLLLVDDEEDIRSIASEFLSAHGYTIRTADTGEAALEIYGDPGGEIDLIILDLGMPGMGGRECLKGLLELDPSVKVIVASGYSNDATVNHVLEAGASGFVAKPYRLDRMLATVRKALDRG